MDTDLVAHGVHSPEFVVGATVGDSFDRAPRPLEVGLHGVEVVGPQEELARAGGTAGFLLVDADRKATVPKQAMWPASSQVGPLPKSAR